MKSVIGLVTGLIAGVGIGITSINGESLLFLLLVIPAVLYLGWLFTGLYFLSHWDLDKFKNSMWYSK